MQLETNIFLIPKHAFDLAHFIPRRASLAPGNLDVLEAMSMAGKNEQGFDWV